MTIRPIDVRRKEFGNKFRGYDPDQVDDFLDSVADEFESVYSRNSRMQEEISNLRERLQQFEELEGAIRAALVQAEQAAKDLRESANREANQLRENARQEADLILREARERSHHMMADSSARVERVQESYEALQKAKQTFAADLRHLLKSYMAVMDNIDIASAKEIEASLRERLDTESIAVAREAAEQERGDLEDEDLSAGESGETSADIDADATRRMEREPAGDTEEQAEPEVEEPEVEPSGAGEGEQEAVPTDTEAAEEVDREEPSLAAESDSDRFWSRHDDGGEERHESEKRGSIFRASRFLRRRD
jgi:cell division initiation protein